MTGLPIRVRMAAAFAVAMALVLAWTGWFLYMRVDSHLAAALDRQLRLRAHDLGLLIDEPGTSLKVATGAPYVERGEDYAQLAEPRGRVVDATNPLGTTSLLSAAELRRARTESFFVNRDSVPGLDEPSRMLVSPVSRNSQRLILIVGATRADRLETLGGLRTELLIAGPIALALASVAGYFLAGLSLRAVESMRRRAAAISAATPGERLPVPRTGDEVERLGETLNEMLARLESGLERERAFVADAGHELRTPLALLRTELELALRHAETPEELRDAVRSASEEADRLSQLADDLLLIAGSDRGRLPLRLETLETGELLSSIANRFEWRAEEAGRRVRVVTPSTFHVHGDRLRLEQALGNLLDNALRYGKGEVQLSAAPSDGLVELHVADEGGGFPPELLDRAFDRFARLDQARARGGSGLGLSIVRAIAEAHGGSAHLANRNGSGADVWVSVPSAGPTAYARTDG
jgi:two-component system, OmpR family, sensor kinase